MTRKAPSKHSWRKRLSIIGLVLFTLYLCFGIWAVPAILISQLESKGSEALGRNLAVERVSFNPFSLEAKLYGVSVGPAEGGSENLLSIGKLSLNPQLSSAFGTLTLKSVELSEVDVWVEKMNSGAFSFQDIIDAQVPTEEPEQPASEESMAAILYELLISDLQLHFKDSSLGAPYEETIVVELIQGRNIGTVENESIEDSDTEGTRFHWDFDGKLSTASGAELELAGGATSIYPWGFELNTKLVGFPLESLQPFVDESVEAKVKGMFGFELTEKIVVSELGVDASVSGGLSLDRFSVGDESQVFATLESLRIGRLDLDAISMDLSIETIEVVSPVFEAILLEDGSARLPVMKVADTETKVPSETVASSFATKINSIVLSNGEVGIEDRSLAKPFKTKIEGIELALSSLAAKQDDEGYDSSGKLDLAMKILGGTLNVAAGLESLEGLATADVSIEGMRVEELQPYASEHINGELQDGIFNLDIAASLDGLQNPSVKGSFGLQNLKLIEPISGKEVAAISELKVDGIDFAENALKVESVSLVEPLLAAWQDDAGINLQRIAKLEAQVEQKAEEMEQESGIRVSVGRFEVESAGVGFVDTTLVSTHNSQISEFDLVVDQISTDPTVLASFEFSGVVDGSARIAGKGTTLFADPSSQLDLDMSFKGYDLTSTSPYWATYLGRKLSKGQFEINSHYEVRDNQLEGTNDFKIDQLTLGEKVQSDRAINLPLGFAIKLMQDPNGMIAYEGLPVSGDLSDPQVKPWGLVGRAFRNLMLNAVASPFKFLAKMAGGREDLEAVAFAIGSVDLDDEARDKIVAIRKVMNSRPGLNLEISYLEDPKEKSYLETRYALHLLANPNFQVVTGLDLLRPVDQDLLDTAVRERYLVLSEESSEAPVGGELEAPVSVDETESAVEKKGLVRRLAGVLKRSNEAEIQVRDTNATEARNERPAPDSERLPDEGEATFPSSEEMLAFVLENVDRVVFDENWIEDLSAERLLGFKTALLESDEIDGGRVFSTDLDKSDSKGPLGSVLIRLSE